jgi:TolB-like protein/predicted Zn-dependent protease
VSDPGKAVFLSYASQDAEAAQNLCSALRGAGIEVWFDQSELRGGDAWDASIRRQIKSCALFIPVISKTTHTRGEGYFRLEWKLAVDRSHLMASDLPFLLPVVVDDTPDEEDRVPDRFREVQWTRLPGGANADAFVDHVRRLLASDATMSVATIVRSSAPGASSTGAASARSPPPASRSFAPWIVGGAVILATSYFAADKLAAPKHALPAAEAPATVPARAIPEKSVAVLPFVDMSERHDQEYFSDGMSEELIDLLTKVPGMRVPARTSSFFFKGKQATIADIAKALNVAQVLEGSVRKSGNRLRITAQLIRVADGYHIWSQTFDRKLDDVFKMQDEIAVAVVNALRASLSSDASLRIPPTTSSEAFTLYLQARALSYRAKSVSDLESATAKLKSALAIEPSFALAWALSAELLMRRMAFEESYGDPNRIGELRRVSEKALALGPNLAEVQEMDGDIQVIVNWDWKAGAAARQKAFNTNPMDPDTCVGLAATLFRSGGRDSEVVDLWQRAVELDPLNAQWNLGLAEKYRLLGRPSEAEGRVRAAIRIDPSVFGVPRILGDILMDEGKPAEANAEYQRSADAGNRHRGSAIAYYMLGRTTDADRALAELEQKDAAEFAYSIAQIHAVRGEIDKSFAWLDRAYLQHDSYLPIVHRDPWFQSLHGDPRWKTFLGKLKLPE